MTVWCILSCDSSGNGLPCLMVLQLLLTICDESLGCVEECSCSLVKTCENSRRLFACMLCEWRDFTLVIGKEKREDVALFVIRRCLSTWSRCHDFTAIVVGQSCGGVWGWEAGSSLQWRGIFSLSTSQCVTQWTLMNTDCVINTRLGKWQARRDVRVNVWRVMMNQWNIHVIFTRGWEAWLKDRTWACSW